MGWVRFKKMYKYLFQAFIVLCGRSQS